MIKNPQDRATSTECVMSYQAVGIHQRVCCSAMNIFSSAFKKKQTNKEYLQWRSLSRQSHTGSAIVEPTRMFQALFDLFPHEALLWVVVVRVRINELIDVFLWFANAGALTSLSIELIACHDQSIRCGRHQRSTEIVGHTQSIETIVGLLSSEMEERECSSTFHSAPTKEIRQVQLQCQTKLRIDWIDIEVRSVIDS